MRINARKTVVDGITFDSLTESKYYNILLRKLQEGQIKDFSRQPHFVLMPDFQYFGKNILGAGYTADFKIIHHDDSEEIIEIKGYADDLYLYRVKLFKYLNQGLKLTELSEYPKNSGNFVTLDELKKIKSSEKRAKDAAKKTQQTKKRNVKRVEGKRIQRSI